jgi:hypothetical protein
MSTVQWGSQARDVECFQKQLCVDLRRHERPKSKPVRLDNALHYVPQQRLAAQRNTPAHTQQNL